ncbi:putative BTB/POZ domain-containing protein [Septoria linicola]|nr:putative BTB/POZ domain-containing protein [Septoria linicola]
MSSTTSSLEQRERPLHELLSRDMVDIYVGSENTHWVLHEKLLCHRSRFFRNIFWNQKNGRKNSVFGLPDEEDGPFKLFVGWLYSESVPAPKEEKDLSPLLDVYLMAEKWEIRRLLQEVMDAVRTFYNDTDSWPSLRRVQYIYSNTEDESPMRKLLVSCVARMLVTSEGVPQHWEHALQKNGQLAVDIIRCVQRWHVDPEKLPDVRRESVQTYIEESQENGYKEDKDDDDDNKLDWGDGLSVPSRNQSRAGGQQNGEKGQSGERGQNGQNGNKSEQ